MKLQGKDNVQIWKYAKGKAQKINKKQNRPETGTEYVYTF